MNSIGFLRSLRILHTALLMGQLFVLLTMLYLRKNLSISTDFQSDVFLIIVPMVSLSAYFLSGKLYSMRINAIDHNMELPSKLLTYRSAYIIRLVVLEAAALLAIMVYYLQENMIYLLIAGVVILYAFFLRPQGGVIKTDAKLDASEMEKL